MSKIFVRLALGGVAGKILGIVREMLLAALFGAGRVVAANRIALTATLIPINFFTADALTAGFLPLYIRYRQEDPATAASLYRGVRFLLALFSVALTAALILGSAVWIRLLGPGLDSTTADIAASMLVVAAVGVPFYVQFNLYALVALAHDDVSLVNIRASFQSIGLIAATLAAFASGHVIWLAWGFTVPYILLFCWGAHWVRRRSYVPPVHEPTAGENGHTNRVVVMAFWRRLRPLLLIPVILQGSIAVERMVGSLLGVGVVAATEYARFVIDSFMALLAAPLGLASLTAFARMQPGEVPAGLRRMISPILLLTVPLSIVLCVNSTGVITLIYGRGQFGGEAIAITSALLLGFALGMWAQVLGYTLVKVINARGQNRQATVAMLAAFSAAILVNVLLYRQLGALTLGLSASVCGLIMLVVAAKFLGVLRFTTEHLAMMLPGVATVTIVGCLLAGPGLMQLCISSAAMLATWVAYVCLIPPLRRSIVSAMGNRTSTSPTAAS